MNNQRIRRQLINKWIELNSKMEEINKYLFEHTELFEKKYMDEYLEDLYRYFAGKITRYARDYNELQKKLSAKESYEMKIEKMRGE